jgi:hypothetical protein
MVFRKLLSVFCFAMRAKTNLSAADARPVGSSARSFDF